MTYLQSVSCIYAFNVNPFQIWLLLTCFQLLTSPRQWNGVKHSFLVPNKFSGISCDFFPHYLPSPNGRQAHKLLCLDTLVRNANLTRFQSSLQLVSFSLPISHLLFVLSLSKMSRWECLPVQFNNHLRSSHFFLHDEYVIVCWGTSQSPCLGDQAPKCYSKNMLLHGTKNVLGADIESFILIKSYLFKMANLSRKVAIHAFNHSTLEADAGRPLSLRPISIEDSQGYTEKPCFGKQTKSNLTS